MHYSVCFVSIALQGPVQTNLPLEKHDTNYIMDHLPQVKQTHVSCIPGLYLLKLNPL